MKEQLIEFKTAKLAKEKGFPIIEKGFYIEGVFTNKGFSKDFHRWYKDDSLIQSAPTQSLLQKWLREVHGLIVFVSTKYDADYSSKFEVDIVKGDESFLEYEIFNTWEQALEKGLYEALKLIKNG